MKTCVLLAFICFFASVYSSPTFETEDLQNNQELQGDSMDYENVQKMLAMNVVPCTIGRARAPWGKCIPCGRYYNLFHKQGEGCPQY